MKSIFLSTLSFLCVSVAAAPNNKAQAPTIDVNDALRTLPVHPDGLLHIADDGVARSYDGQGNVISYVKLSNSQLAQWLSRAPASYAGGLDHLHEVFDHVDGNDVTDEDQILNPPASLRRVILSGDDAQGRKDGTPQSANPGVEVRERLEERQPMYCAGQPCSTSAACLYLGCSACVTIDEFFPGSGGGVCFQ